MLKATWITEIQPSVSIAPSEYRLVVVCEGDNAEEECRMYKRKMVMKSPSLKAEIHLPQSYRSKAGVSMNDDMVRVDLRLSRREFNKLSCMVYSDSAGDK